MRYRIPTLAGVAVGALFLIGSTVLLPVRQAGAQQAQMSYSEDIAPIFRGWCESCHQPGGRGYETSGLDLRTYEGLMKGTKYGSMVVPGEPDLSNLVVLLEGRAQIQMPLEHNKLPVCLRHNIWTWIFQGAKDN